MNPFRKIAGGFSAMARVFGNELRTIIHDPGVLLFFVALPLVYPIIYTLIYNEELVREIPVAVVDNSMTAESRQLVRMASASPTIEIYAQCPNMADAKRLMAERKVFGIMEIPANYSKEIGNGRSAHVTFYSEMSRLLRYRDFVSALADLQIEMTGEIAKQRIENAVMESFLSAEASLPVRSQSNFLGDTQQGFASFVIPGILILILQQSMLLGIAMLAGTSRERRRRNGGIDPLGVVAPPLATVWGRTLCYTTVYAAFTLYDLHIVPLMFNLPHFGSATEYLPFILPMLLATAFLGQSLAPFMRERESPFILIVATSVVFLFISGLTWPRYAMMPLWRALGDIIPATWGIEGFVRINNNAATIADNTRPYLWLWGLTVLYMCTAIAAQMLIERRENRKRTQCAGSSQVD